MASLGIGALFDQDAHQALLPVELTFDRLTLKSSPYPSFLPLSEEVELTLKCRHCGDDVDPDLFYKAIRSLHFIPLDELEVECLSCDDVLGYKEIESENVVGFARFWIAIENCGSSRLNPLVLKHWSKCLGTPLMMVIEHIDDEIDEWQAEDEPVWMGTSGWLESNKPSRQRALFKHQRQKSQRQKSQRQKSHHKAKRSRY